MYLLTYVSEYDYEGIYTDIIGVFSSVEKAEQAAKTWYEKIYSRRKWQNKWLFKNDTCKIDKDNHYHITEIRMDEICYAN